jgi:hypothetical protein
MIKVEKRVIEIDKEAFIKDLKEYVELLKRHNKSIMGIGTTSLNNHFGTKLKTTDFYMLSEKLGLEVRYGKYWYIKDILSMPSNEDTTIELKT